MRAHEPVVSIASSQRAWAAELVRFLSDYGGARLYGTVLTGEDALEQEYEVLVIDDIASYLTPRLIERVHKKGRRVIGVYDSELGEAGRKRLMDMGADAAVEADAAPDVFVDLIASLSIEDGQAITEVPVPMTDPAARRRLITVVGHDLAGDVALALASGFAAQRHTTALVDADTVTPMLAQRLSLPMVPNLLTALDALVQLRGTIDDSLVAGPAGITLLTGLPDPSQWETIQPSDVVDLVDQLEQKFDELIVKVSPHLEDLSQFGGRAGRFEVGRSMLRLSSDVAYVAEPTPLGLSRVLAWIADARRLTDARIHVLFGDAPSSLFQRGELSEELTRSFVPSSITWLPVDLRRVRATWNGEPTPRGPFTRAVAALGTALLSNDRVGGR